MSRREELLGTVLILGLLGVIIALAGGYQMVTEPPGSGFLIGNLQIHGWLALVGAFAVATVATWREAWRDSTRRALAGFLAVAISGFLSTRGGISPHPADALLVLGFVLLGRAVALRNREADGQKGGDQEGADFLLFALWATLSAFMLDPLASARLAVLAILLRRAAVRLVAGWRALGSKLRWLFQAREEAPVYEPVSTGYDPYAQMNRRQRETAGLILGYINQVYNGTGGSAPEPSPDDPNAEKRIKWPDPHISDFYDSPAWEIYVVDKPAVVDVRPFLARDANLAIELGIDVESLVMAAGGVERGVRIEIRKAERETAWFDDVYDVFERWLADEGRSANPYEVVLGLDPMRMPVVMDLAEVTTPHVLIAGTTGSGKSSIMDVIMVQLLSRNSPDDMKVAIIDPKGLFARNYQTVPHLWSDAVTDQRDTTMIIELFKSVYEEMDRRRVLLLQEVGVTSLPAWNRTHPDQKLPVLLLVIDEAQDIGDSEDEEIKKAYNQYVGEIARKGRAYGVLVMIGVQRPSQKNIGQFRGQINRRIILRLTDKGESGMALQADGDETATKLLLKGDGIMQDSNGRQRFAAAYIPADEYSGRPNLAIFKLVAKQVIAKWGGPRTPGVRASASPTAAPAGPGRDLVAIALKEEHLNAIDNATWLVLRGLELAFIDAKEVWDNDPAAPPMTSAGLLPFIARATPDGYRPEFPIDAAFVSTMLTRITGERADKGGGWPFTRATAMTSVSRQRRINEREWYVVRALQTYLASAERPDKIAASAVLGLANRLLAEPLEPTLTAREVDEITRRLLGSAPVENLNGRGERPTAKAVADILVNNFTEVSPDPSPAKIRPSVDDVANRAPRDAF